MAKPQQQPDQQQQQMGGRGGFGGRGGGFGGPQGGRFAGQYHPDSHTVTAACKGSVQPSDLLYNAQRYWWTVISS